MKISVVIPVYNAAPYLADALNSVESAARRLAVQDPSARIEMICVDDGSTDGSGPMLDSFAARVDGAGATVAVRVVHQANGGEGAARNAALAVATGEWVTFLDSDDAWLEDILTSFCETLSRHDAADVIGFRFLPFDDGSPLPRETAASHVERSFETRDVIPSAAVLDLGVFPSFFRRSAFSGIVFSSLPLGADRLYVAECLSRAERLVLSSRGVLAYRVREGSMARAVWDTRKVSSLVDFAAGSLKALAATGRRLEKGGARYLGDVLLTVAPKQLRRMSANASEARRHWLDALAGLDARQLTFGQRVKRAWFLFRGGRPFVV